jgi:hypothetical protein
MQQQVNNVKKNFIKNMLVCQLKKTKAVLIIIIKNPKLFLWYSPTLQPNYDPTSIIADCNNFYLIAKG